VSAAAPVQAPAPSDKWFITMAVMIPTLIEVLDTSVANVALTHIQGSLSAGQEEATWVLTSYLVANAVVIPMSGWLARVLGRKRYLVSSLILFTVSSLLCGAAGSLFQLILFRIVQGVGGGGLQPMSQAILMETFPPHQRGMAMALYGMGVVLGPILGPLLGGWLTDNLSWRWIFYINLPVCVAALLMIQAFVFDPEHMERRQSGEKVDYIGLALLTVGIGALQIVLDKGQQDDWFEARHILILAVVAGVCLVALVFWELSTDKPVVDLRIFRNRSFASGNVVMFLGFFAFFGSIVLLPLFLQGLMGYTAFLSGLVLGPGGAVMLVTMPLAGKMTERIDARLLLLLGLVVSGFALWHMSTFNLFIDFGTAVGARVIQGLGMPFFFVSLSYLTFAWVPVAEMNNASAIYSLLRNLGGSFGTAFVTTVLARRTQFHQARLSERMSELDPGFAYAVDRIKDHLGYALGRFEDHTLRAYTIISKKLLAQASALAFADAFLSQAWLFLLLIPLILIMKKPPTRQRFQAGGGGH